MDTRLRGYDTFSGSNKTTNILNLNGKEEIDMQFKDGAKVFTVEGNQVGRIDRVVLKPATMEITHVVVRKGFLLPEDKVVPMSMIGTTTEDSVTLRSDADDLDSLPDYRETDYIEIEHHQEPDPNTMMANRPRSLFYYPPVGVLRTPGRYMEYDRPRYVTTTQTNIPKDAIALHEGAAVMTSDHEKVGNIERVVANTPEERATHFIIAEGLVFKDRKLIPTDWLSAVSEDEVHLAVDSQFVERLPEYKLEE